MMRSLDGSKNMVLAFLSTYLLTPKASTPSTGGTDNWYLVGGLPNNRVFVLILYEKRRSYVHWLSLPLIGGNHATFLIVTHAAADHLEEQNLTVRYRWESLPTVKICPDSDSNNG